MTRLTEHLLIDHGYRDFAYLGDGRAAELVARYEGFSEALRKARIAPPPQLQSSAGENSSTTDTVRGLLEGHTRPRVLVCATDQQALIALDVLRDHGVDVPTQVAVTGFDGIMAGRLITPTLTTVRQPMEDIGRLAVRILLDTLEGDEDADRHEILSTAVWRGEGPTHHRRFPSRPERLSCREGLLPRELVVRVLPGRPRLAQHRPR